ncbi:hypothetical protein GCM10022404_25680 [Celeribacter arenosi]|uniref:diguanylate cyclase n=1 Tax=Celeribacter arenosi TaxID=792649 RepID=A0ABP7KFZ6_9RHOB
MGVLFAAIIGIFVLRELNDLSVVKWANGTHPLTALLVIMLSVAILGGGVFNRETPLRRALFLSCFVISCGHLYESNVLGTRWIMETVEKVTGGVNPDIFTGSNTAIVIAALSLGALLRRRFERIALIIVLAGLIPITYAFLSYTLGQSGGYGAMSPMSLMALTLLAAAKVLSFSRTAYLRPILTNTVWARFARGQIAAMILGVWVIGLLGTEIISEGQSEWTLSAVISFFIVTILVSGPRIARVERDNRMMARELARKVVLDPMTGLLNRRGAIDYLNDVSAPDKADVALDPARKVGVILADIDHFKRVNDTSGHQVGDEVIIDVARRMKECLRASDVLVRWGGEEFLILLADCDLTGTLDTAESLRSAVAQHVSWHDPACGNVHVTLSMGVAVYNVAAVPSVDMVIREADAALYMAKFSGRNRVQSPILRLN